MAIQEPDTGQLTIGLAVFLGERKEKGPLQSFLR